MSLLPTSTSRRNASNTTPAGRTRSSARRSQSMAHFSLILVMSPLVCAVKSSHGTTRSSCWRGNSVQRSLEETQSFSSQPNRRHSRPFTSRRWRSKPASQLESSTSCRAMDRQPVRHSLRTWTFRRSRLPAQQKWVDSSKRPRPRAT